MSGVQDPSFTPQRSTSLESCWPCLPKRIVIGFDRCRSFLRITPDFLIAYLIHSLPTSVHTPSHILSLSPWIPPRAIVHSKSVSASEPSVVYHSLYGRDRLPRVVSEPQGSTQDSIQQEYTQDSVRSVHYPRVLPRGIPRVLSRPPLLYY